MSTLRSQAIPKHLKTVVLLAALAMPALTTGCRGLLGGSGEPTTPPVTTPPVTTPPVTPPPTPPPPPPPPPPGPQDVTAINHVVLMMQENRSFDSYFGMLNPYRAANGFKTCADGPQYCVDGIDDKLNTTSNVDDEYVQCAAGDTACQAAHTYSLFKLASTCVEDMT